MTIKKQLTALASIIIAIPILCVIFVTVSSQLQSSKRFVSKDENTIKQLSSTGKRKGFLPDEGFALMPPDVDGILLSESGEVLVSTMKNVEAGRYLNRDELITIIFDRSGKYFYHFSPHLVGNSKAMLITRIPREKPQKLQKTIFIPILSIIIILVGISIIVLISIARHLFVSVQILRHQMADISAGKLETPINVNKRSDSNEISEISENLEKMRLTLLETQNKKNKFIMGISHDLRTPIAIIKGYTEALSDGVIKTKAEREKALELIRNKISHLENMINTLISFVKLENSDIRKTLVPKSITKLIKNFAKDAEATMSVFNRIIICDINLDEDYLIPLDEQLVNRVFENLLSNALRYTSDEDEIKICAHKVDDQIIIKFCDSGIGIAESDLANIFDLFYRASNSRREEGMGIGLSVVKNIIETHGWKIDVESEKGKGSCFTIFIPLNQEPEQKN